MNSTSTILLVEDNEAEELLACRAISHTDVGCKVHVCRDGAEACAFLFDGADKPPAIVLLDLNLPKIGGFEVLRRIRSLDRTKRLPVVILSSSDDKDDVDMCFDLHANSYVHKDVDAACYESSLKLLVYYWMAVNRSSS